MFETIIRRGLTDNASRKLIISADDITYENKDQVNNTFTTFTKDKIAEYRFGINWMRYEFTFGREYLIEIRSFDNKILKINFKSYLGYKLHMLHKQYIDILEALWDYQFNDIVVKYLGLHGKREDFEVGNVLFSSEGIIIKNNNTFKLNNKFIPWQHVRTHNYTTYFAIYSAEDPVNINYISNYLTDWNTNVLYSVLRSILRDKEIENYK